MTQTAELHEDERRLAELGYKQDLQRAWSGFSNFAISFTTSPRRRTARPRRSTTIACPPTP